MPDGDQFARVVVKNLVATSELLLKPFQLLFMVIHADGKVKSRILHQVDLNPLSNEIGEKFTEVILSDKRKISW
jgi:hypothetical protein